VAAAKTIKNDPKNNKKRMLCSEYQFAKPKNSRLFGDLTFSKAEEESGTEEDFFSSLLNSSL